MVRAFFEEVLLAFVLLSTELLRLEALPELLLLAVFLLDALFGLSLLPLLACTAFSGLFAAEVGLAVVLGVGSDGGDPGATVDVGFSCFSSTEVMGPVSVLPPGGWK